MEKAIEGLDIRRIDALEREKGRELKTLTRERDVLVERSAARWYFVAFLSSNYFLREKTLDREIRDLAGVMAEEDEKRKEIAGDSNAVKADVEV